MKEQDNNIYHKIKKIEDDLKAQEHRIASIIKNIIDYGFDNSDEQRRNSVWTSLIGYLLSRHTATIIIGAISVLCTSVSVFLAWQANKLIKEQNIRLDQQTYLQEADRRSSLVFLMGNMLDAIDKELKDDIGVKGKRDLSPQLIGRVIALSATLRPYKFMEGDILIDHEISPERGQLLISLVHSNVDSNSLKQIFSSADFSSSYLKNAKFNNMYLSRAKLDGSDLSHAMFSNCNLVRASMISCDLTNTFFEGNQMDTLIFWHSFLKESDFGKNSMRRVIFTKTFIKGATFRDNNLNGSNFQEAVLDGVHFRRCKMENSDFIESKIYLCDFSTSNISNSRISNKTIFDDFSFKDRKLGLDTVYKNSNDSIYRIVPYKEESEH